MIYREKRSKFVAFSMILTIVLVALNLRPSMTAIGPVLDQIEKTIHITFEQASLLTMLPILTMGIGMFIGNQVKAKLGLTTSILISLFLIAFATLLRVIYFDLFALILTAILTGIGIAIVQALLPVYIKSNFIQISAIMGIYATSIMGGATISASLSPWLMHILNGWNNIFLVWGLFVFIAIIAWYFVAHRPNKIANQNSLQKKHASKEVESANRLFKHFFTNRRAWLLAIFFGISTSSYTCILAWFSPYYLDLGFSNQHAGNLLAYLTIIEVCSGLFFPAISGRNLDRRPILLFLISLMIIGYIGLAFAPIKFLYLWPLFLGLGAGGIFPMSLILSLDHLKNPETSGQLTAFVQGIGYTIAAFSPVIASFIRSQTNSFQLSWIFLACFIAIMLPMTLIFNPKKYNELILKEENIN